MSTYLGQQESLVDHEKQFNAPQLGAWNWDKIGNVANSTIDTAGSIFGSGNSSNNQPVYRQAPNAGTPPYWQNRYNQGVPAIQPKSTNQPAPQQNHELLSPTVKYLLIAGAVTSAIFAGYEFYNQKKQ